MIDNRLQKLSKSFNIEIFQHVGFPSNEPPLLFTFYFYSNSIIQRTGIAGMNGITGIKVSIGNYNVIAITLRSWQPCNWL